MGPLFGGLNCTGDEYQEKICVAASCPGLMLFPADFVSFFTCCQKKIYPNTLVIIFDQYSQWGLETVVRMGFV